MVTLAGLVCGSGFAQTLPELPVNERGEINGAPYAIQIPENWNHGLMIFVRGMVLDDGKPMWPPPFVVLPDRRERIYNGPMVAAFERGFAIAKCTYSRKGWYLREAVIETEMLRQHFTRKYGPTSPTLLSGNHGGAVINYTLMEMYSDSYDGAIPWGGIGWPSYDGVRLSGFDLRLLFDHFFPGLPGGVVEFPERSKTYQAVAKMVPELVEQDPEMLEFFLHEYHVETVDRLARKLALASEWLRQLSVDHGLGNVSDNTKTVYRFGPDSAKLNREIPRYVGNPEGREYLLHWLDVTGRIEAPILAVNALYDPVMDTNWLKLYDHLTLHQGTDHLYAQMWVDKESVGHSLAQGRKALDLLLEWIETGTPPESGELVADQ
jgi:hypothetical protein